MPSFQKKPVVIEAVKVLDLLVAQKRDSNPAGWNNMPIWLIRAYQEGVVTLGKEEVYIKTLEGTHRGDYGDWIIQGVKGELYPCKPDIFKETYVPV